MAPRILEAESNCFTPTGEPVYHSTEAQKNTEAKRSASSFGQRCFVSREWICLRNEKHCGSKDSSYRGKKLGKKAPRAKKNPVAAQLIKKPSTRKKEPAGKESISSDEMA